MRLLLPLALAAAVAANAGAAGRHVLPLDGIWQIEDSAGPGDMPRSYTHRVQVPGLAHLATPPFADVDQFLSREYAGNVIRRKLLPESEQVTGVGRAKQNRNSFWYARSFTAPARRQVAILRVNKAQFGTAVWLNGTKIGEHYGCFSAGYFDATAAIRWNAENQLVIRVGAHPGVLPASVPAGTDFEKQRWTPGIYDSVSLLVSDNPAIESVQVAPRIAKSEITVETRLRNYSAAPVSFRLAQRVVTWRGSKPAGSLAPESLTLRAGEERTVTQTIAIPGATLWTPERPFLYVLETSTGGDSASSRFGMREIRFDTATKRAYLNGKLYFLRGSNITLHRFFEDPLSGGLPWDERWLRKLLIEIPKKMHWNSFRFCIGPVPDRWLDLADEAGLLIQNEYFIWTGGNGWHQEWDPRELIAEYSEWMRDNWNHPSVAIWDACNETVASVLGREVIPAARKLDLSNRAWDNGYNLPQDPNDPVEDHPYLFSGVGSGRQPEFRMTDLERMAYFKQINSPHPTAHAAILNEYGWLWLNRDGSPTVLTKAIYDKLLGADATGEQRLELDAYLLAGLTEFWRSRRNYAGVLHFVYLTASYPGAFTSDHFRDPRTLELEPHFADYMEEAFKPLGVYINFFQPALKPETPRAFDISIVNDEPEAAQGSLVLTLESKTGQELARSEAPFRVPGWGQQTYELELRVPASAGDCLLRAVALHGSQRTTSRRRVAVK